MLIIRRVAILLVSLMVTNAFAAEPTTAPSKVVAVTVYQDSALVTREVQTPASAGQLEIVVSPLPPQTIDSSLYSEGSDGIRILTTRYRTRAIKEDMREEVRAKEQQIKTLQLDAEKMQKDVQVIDQNLAMLGKLEQFTASNMEHLTEKGVLSADTMIAMSKWIMEQRSQKSAEQVTLQQQIKANGEAQEFAQRELGELSAGATREERDAVIVIDKQNAAAGTVRLNYLVSAASWHPQYKLRASAEDGPVQLEYLAAVVQQSGEDWTDANIVLSTAEPELTAAPPELTALDVTVSRVGKDQPTALTLGTDNELQVRALRSQAQQKSLAKSYSEANTMVNSAAALEQTQELLSAPNAPGLGGGRGPNDQADTRSASREGPSVTYHLKQRFSIPSRNDEQLIEVARIELAGDFFYKAIPVLTQHVYRQANLTNASEYVLLPGQATMYLGADFVGRMDLPLVAIGEKFTAGFGVEPQLQVTRELVNKDHTVQGGNQVHDFKYRIRVASFKSKAVKMQVWDRLPKAEAESVAISLSAPSPSLSDDATYLRKDRPANLLRWDLTVPPNTNGEKAMTIEYQFKLEYDRNVAIGNFKASQ
jgi:uncharacterized protein (TIGR02231 family)